MGAPDLLRHLRGAGLVLTVMPAGGLHVAPRSALTDDHRAAIRAERDALVLALLREVACASEAIDLAAVAWTDADIARFLDRRARLLRWRWAEPDAEKLADRLVRRDREADPRVSCADCRHYRPGRCGNHKAAGLHSHEVGRTLAGMLQRCPGTQPVR